eukprot:CAMPEP_0198215958 /NCGR_PEP_ID=MMETSP1445-20131203/53829_1 /TAXON_ID=36898 /ORGANISM="Pyramimonas sp., Strain CCMP2087" /LENGTH=306 /DNA_ID=CAMNT_0043891939 /DNA_START=165 /DNA_END=1082 /DNA_ORIENTATION=+
MGSMGGIRGAAGMNPGGSLGGGKPVVPRWRQLGLSESKPMRFSPKMRAVSLATGAGVVASGVWHNLAAKPCLALETSTREERLSRWMEGWSIGRTAFHRAEVNATIIQNEKVWLATDSKLRVLVPLCGKTVDMPYLAGLEQVHSVVGVEGVPLAIEEFIKENPELKMKRVSNTEQFQVFKGKNVFLHLGDFFEFGQDQNFDRVWDRGSLVAIQPALRERYVALLDDVLAPGGKILLEGLHRKKGPEAACKKGPPFSLQESDIKNLFSSKKYTVKKMSSKNILEGKGGEEYARFKSEGLTVMNQEAW